MSAARWGRGEGDPSLARLQPGPHRLPRELVRDHQRQRILLAALDIVGEKGFEEATVKDLLRKAHVSRATFYEVFADMEACLAALHDDVLSWLSEQLSLALGETSEWSSGVRVALAKTIELLSEDPRLAALCAVEAPASRIPEVRAQHRQTIDELCAGLRAGRLESSRGEELPEILEPALVYGAIYLVGRSVVYREGPDAATLAEELAELMLVPYRG